MRRFAGPVLVGLGVFLLVAGLMLKFYAYPKLAVAPIDQNSVTKLSATGANIFDTSSLSPLTTDLNIENRTVGNVKASKDQGGKVRVWASTTSIRSSDGVIRSRSASSTAFDATSAEAVNCCGNFNSTTDGEKTSVKRSGLVFKFPFATEKKTYQVWDDSLGKAVATKYVKETSLDGLKVYEFSSSVPSTKIGTRDVPGSVVGQPDQPTVTGDSMYANDKTYFVEPVTGAIISATQSQKATIAVDGEDKLTTTQADIAYTKAQVAANVKDFKSKASQLSLVKGTLPLVGIILGLIALAAGLVLGRRNDEA